MNKSIEDMDKLKGKRLLILGGYAWFDIIEKYAAEMGIEILSFRDDKSVVYTDHEMMKNLIQKEKIDGVYIGSNEKVIRHAVQYLADLGMPCYCTPKQWDLLMNKRSFKELCLQFDIPVAPKYDYSPDNPCNVDFPVITKPADSCASLGITICNNEKELKRGYQFALENSPSQEVLVERAVKNHGVDVFFQITNGEAEWCVLGDEFPVQFEEGAGSVAGNRVLPSIYTTDFRNRFEDKLKELFKHVGLYQGMIWIEVFHDGDNYYFNEVGYRPNGSISIIGIDYLCGINTVAADIYYALTGEGKAHGFPSLILKDVCRNKKRVCEYWVAAYPGTISEIGGLNELYNHPNILALFPKYDVGATIPHTNGFAQNFCVVHFAFDNAEEMQDIIDFIRRTITLTDDQGEDMIIHKTEEFINKTVTTYKEDLSAHH